MNFGLLRSRSIGVDPGTGQIVSYRLQRRMANRRARLALVFENHVPWNKSTPFYPIRSSVTRSEFPNRVHERFRLRDFREQRLKRTNR